MSLGECTFYSDLNWSKRVPFIIKRKQIQLLHFFYELEFLEYFYGVYGLTM